MGGKKSRLRAAIVGILKDSQPGFVVMFVMAWSPVRRFNAG